MNVIKSISKMFERQEYLDPVESELKEKFDLANKVKQVNDKRWTRNFLYVWGKQHLAWSSEFGWRRAAMPAWRRNASANRIFPAVRQFMSKIGARDFFQVTVSSRQSDPSSIETAKCANNVVRAVFARHQNMRHDISFDLAVFGKTYVMCTWDPDDGDIVGYDSDRGIEVREGDIALLHLMPTEVWVDPHAASIKDARWAFVGFVKSKEYVKEVYGIDVEGMTSEIPETYRLMAMTADPGGAAANLEGGVYVRIYYERSGKSRPEGRRCVLIGSRVVVDGENPYRNARGERYIPIAEANFFPTAKQPFPLSGVDVVAGLQDEYNDARAELLHAEKTMTRGKFMVPTQSGYVADEDKIAKPGAIVYYDGRFEKPHWEPGPAPSPVWMQHMAMVKEEIDDVISFHDVSRGRVPSGIRGHRAIAYLIEQDESVLSITRDSISDMVVDLAWMVIWQANDFYKEDRIIDVSGRDREFEAYHFKRAKLKDINDLKISITEGSKLPVSAVARQGFALELWDRGIIRDPSVIMRMLELESEDGAFDHGDRLDEANAKRENAVMAGIGVFAQVQPYDNHGVHLRVHEAYMKSAEYEALIMTGIDGDKNSGKLIEDMFLKHREMHLKFAAEEAKRAIEMQAAAQAAMPPKVGVGVGVGAQDAKEMALAGGGLNEGGEAG